MNAAESKIFAALKTAALHVRQDGDEPTEALVKSARVHELNPEMVRRTAEMLNVSLTRAHFGDPANDKTASFPVADAHQAIGRVFGDVPEPATKTAAPADSDGLTTLNADERFSAHLRQTGDGWNFVAKTASAKTAAPVAGQTESFWDRAHLPRTVRPPALLGDAVRRAEGLRQELKTAAETARGRVTTTFAELGTNLVRLVGHFQRVDEIPKYAAFESQAYGEYGVAVEPYLGFLRAQLPHVTARGDASHAKVARNYQKNPANQFFDEFMHTLGCCQVAQKEAEAVLADTRAKFAALDEAYRILGGYERPVKTAGDLLDFGRMGLSKEADFAETLGKARGMLGLPDHAQLAADALKGQVADRYAKGHAAHQHLLHKAPADAADAEMANVRREAILRHLLTNDEIISQHDPAAIQSAYNGLLSTAPEVTTNMEVMRSLLRSSSANQALDPFSAKQIADLGNVTLKNQNLRSGKKEDGTPL